MSSIKLLQKTVLIILILSISFFENIANAQMRQVYIDNNVDNEIYKLSFYSSSQGYVAFKDWIGYTVDSGRTFTKKYITVNNVNYNGYTVNLTFGFIIDGVKAFDQNNIIVYGNYGFVPAILRSTDGGNSFILTFHSQFSSLQFNSTITDIAFPKNSNTGYAIDADRILKTVDKGLTWSMVDSHQGANYTYLEAIDDNNVFVFSIGYNTNKILKTTNGGNSWFFANLPPVNGGLISYVTFLDANMGWLSLDDGNQNYYFYQTTNGGYSWALQNDIKATPFGCYKMKFLDVSTGYALSGQNTVYKTYNSGATWEPLPRDNNYAYLNYSHNDLQCLTINQLWAGGGHGFLELSTNGGGTTLPKAFFKIDTTGSSLTGKVNLINYSNSNYSSKWFVNNVQISSSFNASYTHDLNSTNDTISLIVSNGVYSDTVIKYQNFFLPVRITSFAPVSAVTLSTVTISGINFSGAYAVSFGGSPAASFSIISPTQINAIVGNGSTGNVTITTPQGTASLGTFTYIPPPNINLQTSISDSILCKSEKILVTIQNTEVNVRYELIDSLNNSYGFINSNGGTISFLTSSIITTGNYKIKASRLNVSSTNIFTNIIFILVEHTKSVFDANYINILPGEKLNFTNHSVEAQNFKWVFDQDANIPSSTIPNPQNIYYSTSGQKTISLISMSANGCSDTLPGNAVYVFNKPNPDNVCYAQNIDDSDVTYIGGPSATITRVALARDNGYYIGGRGNNPVLKSRIGNSQKFANDGIAYFAKYTTDGVLSWSVHINKTGYFYASESDSNGNVYILGSCHVSNYITLTNGDSIKIAATPTDTISSSDKFNGFILKLDSAGNYLWHTILNDPSPDFQGIPIQGGFPLKIKIEGDQIAIAGSFLAKLEYCRNGVRQNLVSVPNKIYANNSFIIRIREDGSLIWNMYFENPDHYVNADISGIGIDNAKNYYIPGYYEDQVTIHDVNSLNNFTYYGKVNDARSYLLKFDSTGQLIWKVNMLNTYDFRNIYTSSIATDTHGNSYLTGGCSLADSTQYFQITNSDGSTNNVSLASYYLLKFDPNGLFKWGVGSRYSFYGQGISVSIKGSDVFTTGKLSTDNQDSSQFILTSSDGSSISQNFYASEYFIANYDTTGILKRITKSGQNPGGNLVPYQLIIDNNQNYLISGMAETSPGPNNKFVTFNSNLVTNGYDGFFNKLNPGYCISTIPPKANAGPDKTICANDTVSIGSISNSGSNAYSWTSNPAGYTSTAPNPVVTPVVTTTYYLSVADNSGLFAKDTVIVSVIQPPVANAGNDQNICSGSSMDIGTAAIAGNTYNWSSKPAGFTSTLANPSVSPLVNTQYFLSVANASGCIAKDTVKVSINSSALIPSVSISASDTSICAGANITFIATPVNGGNNPSYQWQVNGINTGTNNDMFSSGNLANSDSVKVIMSSSLSCVSNPKANSNIIKISVNKVVTPTVTISSNTNNICPGTNVIFTANATDAGTSPFFQWKINGNNTGTNSLKLNSNTFVNGDIVTLLMISNAPCRITDSIKSNAVAVSVNQSVNPTISISGNNIVVEGSSVNILSSITGGGVMPTYQWQDSTGNHSWNNITGGLSSSINYLPVSTGDKIRCILVSNDACATAMQAISNALPFTITPTNNPVPGNIKYFPNPVNNVMIIDSLKLSDQWETVDITGINGIRHIIIQNISGQTKARINVEMLQRGVYIATIRNKRGQSNHFKFIKQ